MQNFATKNTAALAEELLEAAMRVAGLVRRELGQSGSGWPSVSQLRALSFLGSNEGASLADVAGHIGLGAPATSRLMEDLVKRTLVARTLATDDRRRISLHLEPAGKEVLAAAMAAARSPVAERLERLGEREKARLSMALAALREVLSSEASTR